MTGQFQARVVNAIREVDPERWDACANPEGDASFHPFTSHAFLLALEESQSATARTGWAPYHLLVEDRAGHLLACAPAYLKSHSQGEYVFDHAWGRAYDQAGGRYYPKLQIGVPFTPVPGRRLLAKLGPEAEMAREMLARSIIEVVRRLEISSAHVTFPTRTEWERLGAAGFLQRTDQQFHWENQDYSTFEDFLCALSSRKRKQIRKERREALGSGLIIEVLTGSAIHDGHWDAFFSFYMDTGARKWGRPYLTRDFFSLMGRDLRDRIMLVMCRRPDDRYVAGALNFIGTDTLYGRHWGAVEDHPFLHFEVCYYQAIDFAIANGLKWVEAGAQGTHKLARGYLPRTTYSAHFFRDANFQDAVARYLAQERAAVDEEMEFLAEHSPFRHLPAQPRQDGEEPELDEGPGVEPSRDAPVEAR